MRRATRRLLEAHGYRVIEAPDGDQAIELAALSDPPPRLLLTDVVLPGVGGKELAARLRTLLPGLRVVYMSGYTDDEAGFSAIVAAGGVFLHKPFTREELIAAMSRAAGGATASADE